MITIKQIAKIAGVAPSTVSRCLNGHPTISTDTGKKIKSIATELGFEFNNSARSLRSRKTGSIGIIYGEDLNDEVYNPFVNNLNKNISDFLDKDSFNAIIERKINPYTKTNNLKKLVKSMKVEGLILINVNLLQEEIELIQELHIPVVFIGKKPSDDYNINLDSVVTDYYELGLLATKYLLDLRHRNIITISSNNQEEENQCFQMTKAFKDKMQEMGHKVKKNMVLELENDYELVYQSIRELFSRKNKISAIFAQNEIFGMASARALKDLGYKIPENISIVVSGSDFYSRYSEPKLTTISYCLNIVAENAVNLLLKKISKNTSYRSICLTIEPKLEIRESSLVNNS